MFALMASVISGFSVFLNKYAIESIKSPILLVTSKNLLVGLAIVSSLLLLGKWSKVKALSKNEIVRLVLIAIVGGSLPFYLFFTGLSTTSAINSALIQKTLVLWVAILAVPFLREKLNYLGAAGVALVFLGNIYVGGFVGFTLSGGETMILFATLLWAVESVISKKVLKTVDVDLVASFRMGLGSIFLLVATFITSPGAISGVSYLTNIQISWIVLTALLLFGYVLTWYRALSLAPAVGVTSVLVLATIITNALSAIFVTHTWSDQMIVQTILIVAGVLVSYVSVELSFRNGSVSLMKQEDLQGT